MVNLFNAMTYFRRQNVTSKVGPFTHKTCIQMKLKNLTKTFIMIPNWKKFGLLVYI